MEPDVNLACTISENAWCIGDHNQCAKFHACILKGTIHLKFRAKPPDYNNEQSLSMF